MTRRVALLSCCLSLVQGSVVAAEDGIATRPALLAQALVDAAPQVGPLRRQSLITDASAILRAEAMRSGPPRQDCVRDRGNWMERHPVWAGAVVGFGAGVALTYAVAQDNGDELFKNISTGSAALFWGGVSSGVGALAGWGIGRNRDDGVACRG
jgi:hypothetical protein